MKRDCNVKVVGIQPLPALQFENDAHIYSEFPSYGLGVILTELRRQGLETGKLIHASTAEQIINGVVSADTVIVGDFRPYAYFCNPAPLILKVLEILSNISYGGKIIIGGRHVEHLQAVTKINQKFSRLDIGICATAAEIAKLLNLSSSVSKTLGQQSLPNPGFIDADYAIDRSLIGSARGGTYLSVGQIMTYSGCRYRCSFCEKAQTPIVPFPRAELGRQLDVFKQNELNYVIVWDEVFGQKGTQPEAFLSEVKLRGMKFGCNSRLDVITEEFVEKLADSGCASVLFGVEVSSEEQYGRNLFRLDKGKAPEEAKYRSVVQLLKSYKIKPVASMIIGLPEDTEEMVKFRIKTVRDYGFEIVYARPLVPFPESNFYRTQNSMQQIKSFEQWDFEEFASYPLGYPLLAKIERTRLSELTRWQA